MNRYHTINYELYYKHNKVFGSVEKCFRNAIAYLLAYNKENNLLSCKIHKYIDDSGKSFLSSFKDYIKIVKQNEDYIQFEFNTVLEFMFASSLIRYCFDEQFKKIIDFFMIKAHMEINPILLLSYAHKKENIGRYVNLNLTIFPYGHLEEFNADHFYQYIQKTNVPSFALYFAKVKGYVENDFLL